MSQSPESLYIFEGFSKEVTAYFLLMSQMQYRKQGDIIMRQGDLSNGCAYYIKSGSVQIFKDEQPIAIIREGGFFGEIALITDEPRTATVEVLENTELQVFLKDDFLTIIMQSQHSEEMKREILHRITEHTKIPPLA